MKFGLSQYWKPTPKKIRKIADAVLATSTFISASAIVENYHWLALIAVIMGATAKFLANFFADDN